MNLKANRTTLETLTKELLRRWADTKLEWRDLKAEEFERTYLEELQNKVQSTAATIEKMDGLLQKVRGDCE